MKPDKKQLKALIIEDSEDDALLLVNTLRRGSFSPSHLRVETPDALVKALDNEWDIIFCDYSMPKMNGMQALEIVRRHNSLIPFIFVSGTIGEEVAVEAMRTGAQDYIIKGNMARLAPAVERELNEIEHKKKRREAEDRLHYLAFHDDLTGLPNRAELINQLDDNIRAAKDRKELLALVFLDIDRFKTVNEILGYEAGNLLLCQISDRLQSVVTNSHLLARLAADEFAILLEKIESRASVMERVAKIRDAIKEPFVINDWNLYFAASVGISVFPEDTESGDGLLRNADIATYKVKKEGGNHFRFYSADMAVPLEERLSLDHAMRAGLPQHEYRLHYQPKIETTSGLVRGVEALIRWQREDGSLIGPDRFIPLAEETGFIETLGAWVIEEACAQARRWLDEGLPPLRMAVNMSARQFYDPHLTEMIGIALEQYQLEPHMLELEVTESTVIHDPSRALAVLKDIQALGLKVALDDFGTGYSSLSHLKDFRVDVLKIDRSFIKEIPQSGDSMAITAAVIAMAGKLGIEVVAEGVETADQFEFLRDEGCDFAQGYYFSRPRAARDLGASLRRGDA